MDQFTYVIKVSQVWTQPQVGGQWSSDLVGDVSSLDVLIKLLARLLFVLGYQCEPGSEVAVEVSFCTSRGCSCQSIWDNVSRALTQSP